jgi:hypothetical protein
VEVCNGRIGCNVKDNDDVHTYTKACKASFFITGSLRCKGMRSETFPSLYSVGVPAITNSQTRFHNEGP